MSRPSRSVRRHTAFYSLAIIAVVAVLGWWLYGASTALIMATRGRLVERIETILGRGVGWDSVSPSFATGVTLNNVRIGANGAQEPFVRAARVVVAYNVRELFAGNYDRVLTGVSLYDPIVHYVDSRDRPFLAQFGSRDGRIDPGSALDGTHIDATYLDGVSLEVYRGYFTAEFGDQFYSSLTDVRARVTIAGAELTAELRGEGRVSLPDAAFDLRGAVSARLEGQTGLDDLAATVSLGRLTGTHLATRAMQFRVERSGTTVTARKIADRMPVDLEATFDFDSMSLQGRVLSEAFAARDLVAPGGPWAPLARAFAQPISTDSRFSVDFTSGRYVVEGDFSTYLAWRELPEPLSVRTAFTLNNERLDLRRTRLTTRDGGTALFEGDVLLPALVPRGVLRFDAFRYAGLPTIDGEFALDGRGTFDRGTIVVSSAQFALNNSPFFRTEVLISRAEQRYTVSVGTALSPERTDRVAVRAEFATLDQIYAEIDLFDVQLEHVAAAGAALGVPLAVPISLDDLYVSGALTVHSSGSSLRIATRYLTAWQRGPTERRVAVRGTYTDGTMVVERLVAFFDGYYGDAKALVRFASGGTIDFDLDLSLEDIDYSLRGLYSPDNSVVLSGSYGIQARVFFERARSIVFQLELSDTPLPFGTTTLSAMIDGVFLNAQEWYATIRDGRVDGIPLIAGRLGVVDWNAAIQPGRASVSVTRLFDEIAPLAGTVELRYPQGWAGVTDISARFGAFEGQELYQVAARVNPYQLDATFDFVRSPLQRITPQAQRGTLTGRLRFVGPWRKPSFEINVESRNAVINENDLVVRVQAAVTDDFARAVNVELGLGPHRLFVPEAYIDRVTGSITVEGRYEMPERAIVLPWRAEGVTAAWDSTIDLLKTPLAAVVTLDTRDPFVVEIDRDEAAVVSLAERSGALTARFEPDGTFTLRTGNPLPFAARVVGQLSEGFIEATVDEIDAEVRRVLDLLPLPVLAFTAGHGSGSLRILGPLADPEIYGTLSVVGAQIRTVFSPDIAGPFDAFVVFDERTVRVQPVNIRVGAATLRAEARFILTRLQLQEFRVLLRTQGEEGVRVVQSFGPVAVDGYGRGLLQIDGNPAAVRLSGQIQSYGAQISLDQSFDPATAVRPEVAIIVDLAVSTGRGVQFIWPNLEFPVLRGNAATEQVMQISFNSDTNTADIDGTVEVQSGDIFYFDRSFLIRNGQIQFQETLESFDPRLTARAEIREASPQGTVRIYLVADGQRLSEFSPRFESDPPLAAGDIVAILGGNILAQSSGDGTVNLSTALLSTSDIVTQFGVFRRFEDAVRRRFDLDLFAVRTSVLQNILLTAIEPGVGQVPLTPSLGTYLNNTSVFIGRYIGSSVFAQFLIQMRSTDFLDQRRNDGIQRLGGVLIDSEFSLEWQTPFFLLGWTFAPQNPDELFVRDNTFTFSWRLSY